jgi:hypothetical protein
MKVLAIAVFVLSLVVSGFAQKVKFDGDYRPVSLNLLE